MNARDAKVMAVVAQSMIYVPFGCEGIRIDYWDADECEFYGVGEDSGKSYRFKFSEVMLDVDSFYKLTKVDVESV